MNDSGDKNWRIRVNNETLGPFSEVEMRHWLAEHRTEKSEVQQGNSDWYPAAVILQRFKELARTGIYLRVKGQVEGPFTPQRVVQRIEQLGDAEVDAREGIDGFWVSAKVIMRELSPNSLNLTSPGNAATPPSKSASQTPITPKPPAVSVEKKPPVPQPSGTASSGLSSTVRVCCPVCKATLQIPDDQLGKTIRCASCKKQIRVVGKSTSASTSAPARPAPTQHENPVDDDVVTLGENDFADQVPASPAPDLSAPLFAPFDNLAPISPAATPRPYIAPQPRPVTNPYATPGPVAASPYAGASYGAAPPNPALYIVPGALIAIFSFTMFALSCFGIVMNLLAVFASKPNDSDVALFIVQIGFAAIWIVCYTVIFVGAVHMILRRNLTFSRTSAIMATIPCIGFPFGCLLFPVGVISCVVLFMRDAKRAFQS
ncbi:hypothetical protein SH528x_000617 [Novipirellula sp. SH528]|uniref:hypothetical protein n=1 Tax=Novipirellula sp. SH528 TaxID=3454466 RepID=UPI003F9FD633